MNTRQSGLLLQYGRRSVIRAVYGRLAYAIWAFTMVVALDAAPPPTRLEARLLTSISSYSSRSGDGIEAQVITPWCLDDGGVLPEGAVISGTILRVRRVGLGLLHETASLRLAFTGLRFPDGRSFPVEAALIAIDNARERVDAHGMIHGTRATASISNRVIQHMVFNTLGHPAAMVPLVLLEAGVFHFPDPEITYRRGTELYVDLEAPAELGHTRVCPVLSAANDEDRASLGRLVGALPYWSYTQRQSQPSDLVNLMFTGSRQAIDNAFAAAGWTGSQPNSFRSGVNAIRAIAEDRSFADAPMRTLLLDGEEPEISLQKSLNTFEKRHHLRIWSRPGEWQGEAVWASAATHDTAATFSFRRPFGFTHQIQNAVDLERDKVVSDLAYTGCVDSVTYIDRPESVRGSGQNYRRGVNSDARVAVVSLNACRQPRLSLAGGPDEPAPSGFVRAFRRVTLTARNHFLRDNIFWRSGDAMRIGILALRDWRRERRDERRGREMDVRLTAAISH